MQFKSFYEHKFCVLVQISKLWECEATDAQNFFSGEKVLNAILRAKLKHMKNVLSNEMKNFFCNAEDRFFMSVSFFAEKSHFRA